MNHALDIISKNSAIRLKGFHYHGSYAHSTKGYFLAAKKIVHLVAHAREKGLDVETNLDPYDLEILEEKREVTLCEDCYEARRDDI